MSKCKVSIMSSRRTTSNRVIRMSCFQSCYISSVMLWYPYSGNPFKGCTDAPIATGNIL